MEILDYTGFYIILQTALCNVLKAFLSCPESFPGPTQMPGPQLPHTGKPIITNICQRRHITSPVHISQSRSLSHIFQRICHNSHILKLLGINLNILIVYMEYPSLEFIDRLNIIHHLPHKMAGIVIDAKVFAGYYIKHFRQRAGGV